VYPSGSLPGNPIRILDPHPRAGSAGEGIALRQRDNLRDDRLRVGLQRRLVDVEIDVEAM
jgi:hypothetical protein